MIEHPFVYAVVAYFLIGGIYNYFFFRVTVKRPEHLENLDRRSESIFQWAICACAVLLWPVAIFGKIRRLLRPPSI